MAGRKLIIGQDDLDRMGNEINTAFAALEARVTALEEAKKPAPKKTTAKSEEKA